MKLIKIRLKTPYVSSYFVSYNIYKKIWKQLNIDIRSDLNIFYDIKNIMVNTLNEIL